MSESTVTSCDVPSEVPAVGPAPAGIADAREAAAETESDLVAMARTATAAPAERHLLVVDVDATVLAADVGTVCELDGGAGLPAETARRTACDAEVVEGFGGSVVAVGRGVRRPPRRGHVHLARRPIRRGSAVPGPAARPREVGLTSVRGPHRPPRR